MIVNFASNLQPGQGQTEYFTQESQLLWGKWFVSQTAGGLLDKDTVDAGNTPTTILRPGLLLGVITASGQLTQWNPYATDGSNYIYGVWGGMSQSMATLSGVTERWVGDIIVAGQVKAGSIVIPGQSTAGLSGKSYEFLVRNQLQGRFLFDDDMGTLTQWKNRDIAFTSGAQTFTATTAMHRTHFTNMGSDATGTLVLPAPVPGLEFMVSMVADHNVTLDGPATGEFFPTANTDVLDEDDKQTVIIRAIRTAATPTYQYKISASSAPIAEA